MRSLGMLDFTPTPEQEELRQRARAFALTEILPVAHYFDENDQMPVYLLQKAFEEGLLNFMIPKQYGGQGLGLIEGVLATEEFAAADPGLAVSLFDNELGEEPLILSDNETAKEKYLPEIASQFKLVSYATSEPTMGSDVAGMQCKAVRDGEDYLLNGSKYWITNAQYASYCSVFATVNPKERHKGVCAFFVEMDKEGVKVGHPIPKAGQRCSNTVLVKFSDYQVPAENVLASEGGPGFKLAMRTFARTRPYISAIGVGAARSAMEFAIEYAKKRKAFGQSLSEFQALQFKIAEMYQKVETARLMAWKAAWEPDAGIDPTVSASMSKFYSSEAAFDVVNDAMQIFGGYEYTKMLPVEKLYRDIRVLTIYEGTSQIQRLIVGRHALNDYVPVMPPLEDLPRLQADDPKQATMEGVDKTQKVWRCRICGYIHYGDEPPEECPICGFPSGSFKQVWPQ